MKLSILICGLKERQEMLEELLVDFQEQIEDAELVNGKDIEVLTMIDDRQITTGAKRNALLLRSSGDYICFFDDDDKPSRFYIPLIMKAIEEKPDVIGMRGIYYQDGEYVGIFEHSIQHKEWSNVSNIFKRCPNHLNPIRKEHALETRFLDITVGEDRDYSMRISPLLKTEVLIEKPIYLYYARSK